MRIKGITEIILLVSLVIASPLFAQPLFVDDTTAVGGPFYVGESWGASWGDLNGDLYPDLFAGNHGALNGVLRNNGDGTFSDIVDEVDSERIWTGSPDGDIHGGSWADQDNDGDQDLFVTRSSIGARFQAMINTGLGGFTEESGPLRVGPYGGGRMPMFFDYTKDGNLDISLAGNNSSGIVLFAWDALLNEYVVETSQAGMTNECLRNTHGLISDLFDNGKLHYICVEESSIGGVYDTSTIPFTDVSSSIDPVGTHTDAVLADFNNDLKIDLIANMGRIRPAGAEIVSSERLEAWFSVGGTVDFEDSMTFKADGPITLNVYARVVGEAAAIRIGSTGVIPTEFPLVLDPANSSNFGLVANRTEMAVYVGYNDQSEEWTVMLSTGGNNTSDGAYLTVDGTNISNLTVVGQSGVDLPRAPKLLLNDGTRLVDQGSGGINAVQCGGIAAADFDNDMDVDLYMACRSSTANAANHLYLNDGTGTFTQYLSHGAEGVIGSGIEGKYGTSGQAVTADYNADGFMDVFVTNGNRLFPLLSKDGFSGGGPGQFFRNLANNGNHWIEIDLQGVTDNRDGFGARILVTAGGVTQLREQNGFYHRWSHDSRRLHFGLGSNTTADVTIEWPDGSSDSFTTVAADQMYRATQAGTLTVITPTLNAPSLSITSDGVYEGDTASVNVVVFPPSPNMVSVDYQTVDQTATSGLDYTSVSGTLMFNPLDTEQTIVIPGLTDIEDEDLESFQVVLSNPSNATLNQPTGLVEIDDNDDADGSGPLISISDASVVEGGLAEFTIALSQASADTVIVNFETVDSSAEAGLDYDYRSARVTFNPGEQLSVLRRITTLPDSLVEADETFKVRLFDPENANILNSTAIGTILDSGAAMPDINIDSVSVDEGLSVDLTVSLSHATTAMVTVDYASMDGTALAGSDYTAIADTLTFAANEISKTISLMSVEDMTQEDTETLTVVLSNETNATLATGVGTVSILDDDAIVPEISIDSVSVDEGMSVDLTVSLSAATTAMVTVDYASMDGTALAGSDYTAIADTLTFAPYETSKTISLMSVEDMTQEDTEMLTVVLSNETNATLATSVGTVSILDDDAIVPEISIDSVSVDEGMSVDLTVSLSAATTAIVTVDYASMDGTALAGSDYTAIADTLTFAPYETSKTISLMSVEDMTQEDTETLTVVLSNETNATLATGVGMVSILDDDAIVPEISIDSVSVDEGMSVDLTVSLSAATTAMVTVDYASMDGTALAGSDYTAIADTLTFAANEISKTISLMSVEDMTQEDTETLTVVLSNETNATLATGVGTVSILDDDAIVPEISIDSVSVDEGMSVDLTVSLSAATTAIVTVDYASMDGTALAGSDYTAIADTLTFAPYETSKTISLMSVEDMTQEDTEMLTVVLSNETNATLATSVGTVSILDDDAIVPEISIDSVSVDEGMSVDLTVSLSAATTAIVTVDYASMDGTALAGSDYTAIADTLTFAPYETSKTISLMSVEDMTQEDTETLTVVLSNETNATLATSVGTVSILDDDAIVPEISIDSVSVDEGMSVDLTVSLSAATTAIVTVDYASMDGTALAGSDYTAIADTLTFAPYETSKTISLVTLQDSDQEGSEELIIEISNVGNATLGAISGVVAIVDDEPPLIRINNGRGVEGRTINFTISLSQASSEIVSVDYATQGDTAESDVDFVAKSGAIIFEPGQISKTIKVSALEDSIEEPKEVFSISLSNPVQAAIQNSTAIGAIVDKNAIAPLISIYLLTILSDD